MDQLSFLLCKYAIDVLCITESMLDDSVIDSELSIAGYHLLRKDRTRMGGGCAIYFHSSLDVTFIDSLHCNDIEILWCDIKPSSGKSFLLGCLYRPPSSNVSYFNKIVDNVEMALNISDDILVMGDFNIDVSDPSHQYYSKFTAFCDLCNLTQLISEPTRVTDNSSSTIDLICTSMPERHSRSVVIHVALSDHYLVSTVVNSPLKKCHKVINCRTFKYFDPSAFLSDMSRVFYNFSVVHTLSVSEQWESFCNLFLLVCDYHAPYRSFRIKGNSVPWVDNDIIKLMKERDTVHCVATSEGDPDLFNQYRLLRNNVTAKIRSNKKRHITNIINSSNNSKSLWRAISIATGKSEHKEIVPNVLTPPSLNNYFVNIGSQLSDTFDDTPPMWKGPDSTHIFKFTHISETQVRNFLSGLPDHSNVDLLHFDTKLLRIANHVISRHITDLFNLSINQALVPNDWKKAKVTPIYKGKGSRSDPSNYRPISVICHIAKVFEKCVRNQLITYLNKYNFISCDQSAFLKNHSTVTTLHRVVDNWLCNIDDGLITVVCYFDITKCFDSINHDILLFKLDKYGIRENELAWFTSYLSGRTQATFVHNSLSSFLPVSTGVPQGSILGPLLFLLFIDDLSKHVSSCNLYADDTMIDHTGKTLCEIVPKMQHDINSLCNWFAANKLTISVSKSCSMVIGSPQNVNAFSHYESLGLFINGVPLRYCSSYKYLGLEIDSTLSWNNATSNVCKKLRSRLAVLQRLCNVLPVANINNLYYSFIQCHIDYCLTVWGHTSQGNIETIQRFQNRAGRILSRNFDYINFSGISIVKELGWLTVSVRKDYLTLITIYKCINNLAPHYLIDMFNYVTDIHGRLTRQSSAGDLYIHFARTVYKQRSLQYYGPQLWNSLPNCVRDANSLEPFKTLCKLWLLSKRHVNQ